MASSLSPGVWVAITLAILLSLSLPVLIRAWWFGHLPCHRLRFLRRTRSVAEISRTRQLEAGVELQSLSPQASHRSNASSAIQALRENRYSTYGSAAGGNQGDESPVIGTTAHWHKPELDGNPTTSNSTTGQVTRAPSTTLSALSQRFSLPESSIFDAADFTAVSTPPRPTFQDRETRPSAALSYVPAYPSFGHVNESSFSPGASLSHSQDGGLNGEIPTSSATASIYEMPESPSPRPRLPHLHTSRMLDEPDYDSAPELVPRPLSGSWNSPPGSRPLSRSVSASCAGSAPRSSAGSSSLVWNLGNAWAEPAASVSRLLVPAPVLRSRSRPSLARGLSSDSIPLPPSAEHALGGGLLGLHEESGSEMSRSMDNLEGASAQEETKERERDMEEEKEMGARVSQDDDNDNDGDKDDDEEDDEKDKEIRRLMKARRERYRSFLEAQK
ncbi:hypothetical protein K402DRAFT_408566 [Aulographum hederae CBS 113979]|uniref:Uncharacterized protein n=1 Tax=Aulographum hederae CBS 113979 TaxID=1176131 RepID=A0A6G1GJY8_9PEZI|nr:hypothetical protein K402DRAFT_408566 [Aulographum hederae CBS 113979]